MAKEKQTLREKLAAKRKELEERGKGKGNILYLKEGTVRIRILPVKAEEDWAIEATTFYLNQELKGVISPDTFGEPCPIKELYEELKASKKPKDKEAAKRFIPKKKYYVAAILFQDTKGKEVDTEKGIKLVQLTSGIYGEIIDHFLDPDWGDFTDPIEGYDFKLKRVGAGKMDTVYSCSPCPKTPLPKAYKKTVVDLEALLRESIDSYETILDKLTQFQGAPDEEDEDEDDEKAKRRAKRDKLKKRSKDSE